MASLSYLATLTPIEIGRLLRRRLPGLRRGPSWTGVELMFSPKHSRGIRLAELLLRQEAVLTRAIGWRPLEFENRRVAEIGCGPLAGFGPLAIFRGAREFAAADPEWDEELFFSPLIRNRYLRVLHADLSALYGPLMSFNAWLEALSARQKIHRAGFAQIRLDSPVDVVLSQSCLEHVVQLDDTVAAIARLNSPGMRQLHLVDFGNHYPTESPFDGLYDVPRSEYLSRRGPSINLLRAPDVLDLFASRAMPIAMVKTRVLPEQVKAPVHPWWRERYDDCALATQLALIATPT